MNVRWFNDPDTIATTDHDGPGRCIVTWESFGDEGIQCYGWIEGGKLFVPSDGGGKLFVPSDGDGKRESDLDERGLPAASAHWYECATGKNAIHGIPGATLTVFE